MPFERTYFLDFDLEKTRRDVWYAKDKPHRVLVKYEEDKSAPAVLAQGELTSNGRYVITVTVDGHQYAHEYIHADLKCQLKSLYPNEFPSCSSVSEQ